MHVHMVLSVVQPEASTKQTDTIEKRVTRVNDGQVRIRPPLLTLFPPTVSAR